MYSTYVHSSKNFVDPMRPSRSSHEDSSVFFCGRVCCAITRREEGPVLHE